MKLKVLIDTNILYTFLSKREDPYYEEVIEVMFLCIEKKIEGYLAFHSISTIWYMTRKLNVEILLKRLVNY